MIINIQDKFFSSHGYRLKKDDDNPNNTGISFFIDDLYNYIIIKGMTPEEVAKEINKQLLDNKMADKVDITIHEYTTLDIDVNYDESISLSVYKNDNAILIKHGNRLSDEECKMVVPIHYVKKLIELLQKADEIIND